MGRKKDKRKANQEKRKNLQSLRPLKNKQQSLPNPHRTKRLKKELHKTRRKQNNIQNSKPQQLRQKTKAYIKTSPKNSSKKTSSRFNLLRQKTKRRTLPKRIRKDII